MNAADAYAAQEDALLALLMAPRQPRLTVWPILYKGAEQDAAARLLIDAGRLTVVKTGPGYYVVEVA